MARCEIKWCVILHIYVERHCSCNFWLLLTLPPLYCLVLWACKNLHGGEKTTLLLLRCGFNRWTASVSEVCGQGSSKSSSICGTATQSAAVSRMPSRRYATWSTPHATSPLATPSTSPPWPRPTPPPTSSCAPCPLWAGSLVWAASRASSSRCGRGQWCAIVAAAAAACARLTDRIQDWSVRVSGRIQGRSVRVSGRIQDRSVRMSGRIQDRSVRVSGRIQDRSVRVSVL